MFRNRLGRLAALLTLSCGLGNCAIHPLPSDVTGYKTIAIVQKIRCEAREAIIEALKDPTVQKQGDNFLKAGIVFAFALEGTEAGGLSLSADIIKPLAHGTGTLSPSVGNTLSRDNIRSFTISDNFSELREKLHDADCNFDTTSPNYEYPIVGRIGVDEMITTFTALALTGGLGAQQDLSKGVSSLSPAGLPAMVDTITFTTTISAGLTSKMVLSPVGKGWQLMDATFPGTVSRVDKHQVIIGLALPPKSKAGTAAINTNLKQLFVSHVAKGGTATGENAAAQAVAQQILRFGLPTPLIVP